LRKRISGRAAMLVAASERRSAETNVGNEMKSQYDAISNRMSQGPGGWFCAQHLAGEEWRRTALGLSERERLLAATNVNAGADSIGAVWGRIFRGLTTRIAGRRSMNQGRPVDFRI
jgi:hypothetical protein